MDYKKLKLEKHTPDKLDKQCESIFHAIKNTSEIKEKISILEQCIDYLRMEESNEL